MKMLRRTTILCLSTLVGAVMAVSCSSTSAPADRTDASVQTGGTGNTQRRWQRWWIGDDWRNDERGRKQCRGKHEPGGYVGTGSCSRKVARLPAEGARPRAQVALPRAEAWRAAECGAPAAKRLPAVPLRPVAALKLGGSPAPAAQRPRVEPLRPAERPLGARAAVRLFRAARPVRVELPVRAERPVRVARQRPAVGFAISSRPAILPCCGPQHRAGSFGRVQRQPLPGHTRLGQNDEGHRRAEPRRRRRLGSAGHLLHGHDVHHHHHLRPVR